MPVHFPDGAMSPAEKRGLLFRDVFYGRGWCRYTPAASILLLGALVNDGPMTRDQLVEWVRSGSKGGERGWGAPAWDPVKTWTDEEWEQARQDAEDGPFAFGPDAPATAA